MRQPLSRRSLHRRRDAILVIVGAGLVAVAAVAVWARSGESVSTDLLGLVAACVVAFGLGELAPLDLHGRALAPIATAAGLALALTQFFAPGSWIGAAYVLTLVAAIQVVAGSLHALGEREVHVTEMALRLLAIGLVAVAARVPVPGGTSFIGMDRTGVPLVPIVLWGLSLSLLGVVAEQGMSAFLRSRSDRTRLGRLLSIDLQEAGGLALAVVVAAAAIATSSPRIGMIAVPIFLVPLVLVRVGMRRFHAVEADRRASLLALARLTDDTGHTTRGHAESVAELAVATGRRLGLDADTVEQLRAAALLHDVGQVALETAIPGGATVLAAPGDQQHVADATIRILTAAGGLEDVLEILAHQTTPFRRVRELGEDVPLTSRILKAANAYVDLTGGVINDRVHARAMERLTLGLGYEYDPAVLRALELARSAR